MMLAAVRVRGVPDTGKKVRKTLNALRLHNKNNAMVYRDTDATRGMLDRVRDHVAYGEISDETAAELLRERGRIHSNPLDEELDEVGFDSVEAVVAALADEDVSAGKLHSRGMDLPFRLSPPSKGFGGSTDATGKRDDMDELIGRMV